MQYPIPRRWPRHPIDVSVLVITNGPAKVAAVQGWASALNCGGMTISVVAELAIDDQLAVRFTPPGCAEPITLRCFVRDRHQGKYGVEFITEKDADYENVGQLESILKVRGAGSNKSSLET